MSDEDDFAALCGLNTDDFKGVEDANADEVAQEPADDEIEMPTRPPGHTIFSWHEVHPAIIKACWLFRQMAPVVCVIDALKADRDAEYTTEAFQTLVVEHIVIDPPRAYQPSASYIANFLKKYMAGRILVGYGHSSP